MENSVSVEFSKGLTKDDHLYIVEPYHGRGAGWHASPANLGRASLSGGVELDSQGWTRTRRLDWTTDRTMVGSVL